MFVPHKAISFSRYVLLFLMPLMIAFLLSKQSGCFNKSESIATMLVDEHGNVINPVLDLLKILNVQHDGTLNDIVTKTQKLWIRSVGSELWDVKDKYHGQADMIIPLLKKIGCLDAVYPQQKEYDYLLFLGASLWTLRLRLASVIQWWKNGVRFKKIVFLTGQRFLDPALEPKDALLNIEGKILPNRANWKAPEFLPIMETDMMKMVYDQVEVPTDMRDKVEIEIIDSPQRTLPNGKKGRPITDDTITSWLATNPSPGNCLAVSNQPHLWRQHAVLRTLIPKEFSIESAGGGVSGAEINISSFLDTIARWLYQENEYTKKVIRK